MGGGGVSFQLILITWPQAVRQIRGVGERGERRVGVGQITAHGNPYSSFSLSFFPLCVRRDEKILLSAAQYMYDCPIWIFIFVTDQTQINSVISVKNLLQERESYCPRRMSLKI